MRQRAEIELRVDLRARKRAMPKYIGYGFACDPVVCHSCGQGVTEDVRAGTMNRYPGTLEQFLNEGNYYSVLGVSAIAGRAFDGEIDRSPSPVAVISYAFWQRRFGMNPAAIGKSFRVNQTVFTVVGVTPPEFQGVAPGEAPDVTFPLSVDGEVRGGQSWLPWFQTNSAGPTMWAAGSNIRKFQNSLGLPDSLS